MRLLTQKEWKNPKYLNEGILKYFKSGIPLNKLKDFFEEVFINISVICNNKNSSNEIFGVAMTLFHYYTYYKHFYEYDRTEIAKSCVFLAFKLEYSFLKVEEAWEIY